MTIKNTMSYLGEQTSLITDKIISYLGSVGINISSAKVLNLTIILILLYLVIGVLDIAKKPLKWIIIVLLIVLGVSTIFSIF